MVTALGGCAEPAPTGPRTPPPPTATARVRHPATEVRVVKDVYHGVEVADPYRWLEKAGDPEITGWSARQNASAAHWPSHRFHCA